VLATLATTRTDTLLSSGESTAEALTDGYRLAFLIGAGLVVAAIGVALAVLKSEPAVAAAPQEDEAELAEAEAAYSEAA
jgi:hypothetical protein